MNTYLRIFAVAGIVGLIATDPIRADEAGSELPQVTIKEIVKNLKSIEAKVETLSVTYDAKRSNNFGILFGNDTENRSTFTEKWQVDTAGRGWNEAQGKTTSTDDASVRRTEFKHIASFDGKSGRTLTTETHATGKETSSGSIQPALIRYAMSPFDLTTQHQGKPISESIARAGSQIVGTQKWSGHSVVLVETKPVENNGEYKAQFWIDPNRNFVVVRRRNLMRQASDKHWSVNYSVDCFKHEQIAEGVWLPAVAWTKSFAVAKGDEVEGTVVARCDVNCSAWKINEEIPLEKLVIEFPPGLKVNGLKEQVEANIVKSKNFIVEPITTPLQRKLVGSKNSDVYAKVDVTAFVDVNTHLIDLAKFDFAELRKRLKAAADGNPKASLYLSLDYGALGTDDTLGTFVEAPLNAIAKRCGFANVRNSSTYRGGGGQWRGIDESEEAAPGNIPGTEENLGNATWDVFIVSTPLSRYLASDADCLIQNKVGLPLDTTQLLDDEVIHTLAAALENQPLSGNRLNIKIRLGTPRADPDNVEKLAVTKQGSKIQLAVVEQLRELGFGDINLTLQIGYRNFNSGYRLDP